MMDKASVISAFWIVFIIGNNIYGCFYNIKPDTVANNFHHMDGGRLYGRIFLVVKKSGNECMYICDHLTCRICVDCIIDVVW